VCALPASIQNNCTNLRDYNGLDCLTVAKCTTGAQVFFAALSHRHRSCSPLRRRRAGSLADRGRRDAPTERGQRGQAHRLATRSTAVHFRSGALPGKHAEGPVMTCSGGDAQLLLDIGHHRVC
jgi:hypothetical protein